ncbi:MAG: phage integrase N-terminal SAM-like domain-containing protein [Bacteroidota bacterium]
MLMQPGVCIGREAPLPDGRQTRIDFAPVGIPEVRKKKQAPAARQHSFDFFALLSSWLKSGQKKPGTADLEGFRTYLVAHDYSKKSCSSYLFMLRRFFAHFEGRRPESLTMGDIEDYNYEYFVSGRYSRPYQLQFISAVRLYYLYSAGVELNLKHLRKTDRARKKRN